MTSTQKADLQAFQHEIEDSTHAMLLTNGDALPGAHDVASDPEHEDGGDSDEWVDEMAIVEGIGLPSNSSSWASRLANEHNAWTEQLTALCDAYLSYRSGAQWMTDEEASQEISVLCVSIACEYSLISHIHCLKMLNDYSMTRSRE